MKSGDLIQYTLRRRGSEGPYPVGILLDIRAKEYPMAGERELDYIIMVDGVQKKTTRRYLKPVTVDW